MLNKLLRNAICPACGHHIAVTFFDGGNQPLATIAWPKSADEARSMPRLPLSFVRCVDCGHVFNEAFDYAHVPYSDKPNLMFNRAGIWSRHLERMRDLMLELLPERPVVVEIGCGEGLMLRALADARPDGSYIGFDPNATVDAAGGSVEARQELFDPAIHLAECRPDMIISRHVLEHLMNPLGFLQRLAFSAEWQGIQTRLFLEVPCIDRVFESGRIADFYYEHNSHFTTRSFTRMLERCSTQVKRVEHGYDGEVIFGVVEVGSREHGIEFANEAIDFGKGASLAKETIGGQLDELHRSGARVAIWGGTGKSAAFINYYGVDAVRFPVVVDSDRDKAGTYVPGAGQLIRFRDHLLSNPVEVILIPTQWRARDIVEEIKRSGIAYRKVLIEHKGVLIDFHEDVHPYRGA